MIQRIQSLYLFLTSALAILFLSCRFLSFFNTSGSEIVLNFAGIWRSSAGETNELIRGAYLVPAFFILIAILSLIAIFLFRNRKLQIKLSMAVIVLSVAGIAALIIIGIKLSSEFSVNAVPVVSNVLPLLILVLSILACRAIRKDEKLVRSYDRLR